MEKDAKIYVAGHRGLVGSAVYRRLQQGGYGRLVTATRDQVDLRRQDAVERFFDREKPEYVFLSAAKVGGILANSTYRAEFIYDNLAIALNVINAAHKAGVKKLLNLGSSCIYPKMAPQPMKEECLLTGPLEQTNEPYAIAKIAAIKLCRYYNEQYGTDFMSVMPTNLYGVNDNFNFEVSHVLAALIRKFYLAKLLRDGKEELVLEDVARSPLGFGIDATLDTTSMKAVLPALHSLGVSADSVSLWGTGAPFREFLHVDDLADASVYLMERFSSKEVGELVNVGTGKDQTIHEIATLVKTIYRYDGVITYDKTRPDGTPRKLLDVSRLAALRWQAHITLEQGLRKTIEWYTAQSRRLHHAGT